MDANLLLGLVLILAFHVFLVVLVLRSKPARYDERFAQIESGKGSLEAFRAGISATIGQIADMQKAQLMIFQDQLSKLTTGNEQGLDKLRETIDDELKQIQADNAEKLEKMRATVDERVLLPVDAKFPKEDCERLLDARERGDPAATEEAPKASALRLKASAKEIRDKYLNPPATTDFGIMFLPSESLYAESLRRAGLVELLQKEYRVTVTGPTTLAAILNSLPMGFRTLAIEKRSSEVWQILGAVKAEVGKFGELLEKTKRKIQEAGDTIDSAARVVAPRASCARARPCAGRRASASFSSAAA